MKSSICLLACQHYVREYPLDVYLGSYNCGFINMTKKANLQGN